MSPQKSYFEFFLTRLLPEHWWLKTGELWQRAIVSKVHCIHTYNNGLHYLGIYVWYGVLLPSYCPGGYWVARVEAVNFWHGEASHQSREILWGSRTRDISQWILHSQTVLCTGSEWTPEVHLSSLMDWFNEFPISLTLKGTFSLPIYFFQDALEMHFITNYLKY